MSAETVALHCILYFDIVERKRSRINENEIHQEQKATLQVNAHPGPAIEATSP
jgi:hypothetical protein